MRRVTVRTAIVLLLGLLITGSVVRAHDATPNVGTLPDAPAPLGLGSVTLPDDEAAILTLFDLLPNAIAGESETAPAGHEGDRIVRA